jgi:preprotein translocase subunit SecG
MCLKVIFVLLCVVITVVVLAQEGKSSGLGSIGGAADTFWNKNKGRTIEGKLEKSTRYMCIAFFVLAIAISIFYNN